MIRILIADDHLIVRTGLAALLGTEKDMEVVGQAKNGIEAVREAVRLKPDIVIMDLMMPKMDGVAATAEIAAKSPETRKHLVAPVNPYTQRGILQLFNYLQLLT